MSIWGSIKNLKKAVPVDRRSGRRSRLARSRTPCREQGTRVNLTTLTQRQGTSTRVPSIVAAKAESGRVE